MQITENESPYSYGKKYPTRCRFLEWQKNSKRNAKKLQFLHNGFSEKQVLLFENDFLPTEILRVNHGRLIRIFGACGAWLPTSTAEGSSQSDAASGMGLWFQAKSELTLRILTIAAINNCPFSL